MIKLIIALLFIPVISNADCYERYAMAKGIDVDELISIRLEINKMTDAGVENLLFKDTKKALIIIGSIGCDFSEENKYLPLN